MQPIRHEPEYVQALELLNFGQVELEKIRDDGTSTFSTTGDLSVLYFDYYERFILQLGNWRYCLLPRLPATSINESEANFYQFPAYDGNYSVKLPHQFSPAAIQNLETILAHTTKFNEKIPVTTVNTFGQHVQPVVEKVTTVVETSTIPTGGILRENQTVVQSVQRDVEVRPVGQVYATHEVPVNYAAENASHHSGSGQFGGYYQRTGQVVNIGNTNYESTEKKPKKGLKTKLSRVFKKKPRNAAGNPNMLEVRDFLKIKATDETMVPVVEFKREEIEAVIVSAKEIARKIEDPRTEEMKEKVMGVVETIKDGMHDIREKLLGEKQEEDPNKPSLRRTFYEGVTDIKEKVSNAVPDGGSGALKNAIMVASVYDGVKQVINNLKETQSEKSRYKSEKDRERRDHEAAIPAPYHSKHPLSQRTFGENVDPYDEHIGMRNIVREEYYNVKDKIEHRKEITGNVGGSLETAFVAATVFDGAKDVTCRLFHEGKYKVEEKLHKEKEEGPIEYTPREPISKRQIVKDGYADVKYKIEHRQELTGNVGGSIEKAFVASTVLEGAKDVSCSLFHESKAEVQDKLAKRKYEKQFEPEKPSLTTRVKEGALELKHKIMVMAGKEEEKHAEGMIEGGTIIRESNVMVQSADPLAPEYHTRTARTVVYRSNEFPTTTTESTTARIGPIRNGRSHSPVSKREIVFASLPVVFGSEKKKKDEIPSEGEPVQRDFIDKFRDALHRLGEKLSKYPQYDTDITATKDVNFPSDHKERTSFTEKIVEKVERTASQIPEYEPEVYVEPAKVMDYDRQGEQLSITTRSIIDTPSTGTGLPSSVKVLKSRIVSVKPIPTGTPFSGTTMSGDWKGESTALTENVVVTSQMPTGNYVSRNLEKEFNHPESQVIGGGSRILESQNRMSQQSNLTNSSKQVYEPMYYTEG